jgi:hypothetical protein
MVELSGTHGDHIVCIEALGVGIDISVSGDQAAAATDAISRAWSGALRVGSPPLRTLRVYAGDEDVDADLVAGDLEILLHHLSQVVTRVAIEARAGDLMMLHAAGLADRATGATVALVAPSGTGKTTLCRTLGDDYAYVSDETVGFDPSLVVSPYRKPLSVVVDGHHIKAQVSPEELGLPATPPVLTLSAAVLLERSDVPGLEVTPVRTVAALPLLAEQSSYLSRHTRPLGFLAEALERTGGLYLVNYRSAEELRPLVRELCAAAR